MMFQSLLGIDVSETKGPYKQNQEYKYEEQNSAIILEYIAEESTSVCHYKHLLIS